MIILSFETALSTSDLNTPLKFFSVGISIEKTENLMSVEKNIDFDKYINISVLGFNRWNFYRNPFQNVSGNKVINFI